MQENSLMLHLTTANTLVTLLINSPADRGTKKHVYLHTEGQFPFGFILFLYKVSIFLNVGHVEISCGLLTN